MADFSLRPYGIDVRGEFIEKADATGFKADKNGNVISREFCENPWRHVTPESAIAEAQRPDNLCSWDFSSGWGGAGVNSTVDFFGHSLPCRDMSNTGNFECLQDIKNIPSKDIAYIFSVWTYCVQKTAGTQYLGVRVYDATSSTARALYIKEGTTTTTNPYFQYWGWSSANVPKNKWVNYRGILVPTDYTDASKLAQHYTGGAVMDRADMRIVDGGNWYRFGEDNVRMRIRFLDYYNNGQQSYSYWVLPSVLPVAVADIRSDKSIFRHIKEGVI